jgi:putative NADPH-quinone reductase
MKVLTILAHGSFAKSRINKAWSEANKADGRSVIRELYSLYPEGTPIDVATEQKLITEADRIVFQFPLWWYSAPHLLKKYIDEVFTYGFAFGRSANLAPRQLLIATSTGASIEAYQPGVHNNYALHELLRPFQQTANMCGLTYLTPFVFYNSHVVTDKSIRESAAQFVEYIHDEKLANPWRLLNESTL